MTKLLVASPGLLQTAAADTVVFVQARDALALTADLAIVVIAVLLMVLAVSTTLLVRQLYRIARVANRTAADVRRQVTPTAARIQSVADNLTYVTASIREDMERVHESVAKLTGRLNQASNRIEERIEEFNALLEVVQTEAEDLFIDTATTVRAVKAGARSLSRPTAEPSSPPPEEA
jgi:methyl-accepting chemotaxis protein